MGEFLEPTDYNAQNESANKIAALTNSAQHPTESASFVGDGGLLQDVENVVNKIEGFAHEAAPVAAIISLPAATIIKAIEAVAKITDAVIDEIQGEDTNVGDAASQAIQNIGTTGDPGLDARLARIESFIEVSAQFMDAAAPLIALVKKELGA